MRSGEASDRARVLETCSCRDACCVIERRSERESAATGSGSLQVFGLVCKRAATSVGAGSRQGWLGLLVHHAVNLQAAVCEILLSGWRLAKDGGRRERARDRFNRIRIVVQLPARCLGTIHVCVVRMIRERRRRALFVEVEEGRKRERRLFRKGIVTDKGL